MLDDQLAGALDIDQISDDEGWLQLLAEAEEGQGTLEGAELGHPAEDDQLGRAEDADGYTLEGASDDQASLDHGREDDG